jgi:hypothetical protein
LDDLEHNKVISRGVAYRHTRIPNLGFQIQISHTRWIVQNVSVRIRTREQISQESKENDAIFGHDLGNVKVPQGTHEKIGFGHVRLGTFKRPSNTEHTLDGSETPIVMQLFGQELSEERVKTVLKLLADELEELQPAMHAELQLLAEQLADKTSMLNQVVVEKELLVEQLRELQLALDAELLLAEQLAEKSSERLVATRPYYEMDFVSRLIFNVIGSNKTPVILGERLDNISIALLLISA